MPKPKPPSSSFGKLSVVAFTCHDHEETLDVIMKRNLIVIMVYWVHGTRYTVHGNYNVIVIMNRVVNSLVNILVNI
jgi:hypothetical protein